MPITKVKPNYQITIPPTVREAVGIEEGDRLEARVENGHVVLIPQRKHRSPIEQQPMDISSYIGSMKGAYGATTEEIQAYLCKERDEWL